MPRLARASLGRFLMARRCWGKLVAEASWLRLGGPALTLPTSQGVSQWQDLEQGPNPAPEAPADQEEEEEEEGVGAGPREAQWPLLDLPGASGTGAKGWALTTAP